MAQLAQCLRFDLTDALTGDIELRTDLFKGTRSAVHQTETQPENICLTVGQRGKYLLKLFLQERVGSRISRSGRVIIRDEVAKVGILLLTDRRFE